MVVDFHHVACVHVWWLNENPNLQKSNKQKTVFVGGFLELKYRFFFKIGKKAPTVNSIRKEAEFQAPEKTKKNIPCESHKI